MKKKIFVIVLLLAIIATGLYFYMYKSHRDITTEKADFSTSVSQLQQEFSQNNAGSNKKYLDKTIEIKGKITTIDLPSNAIVLDDKVYAVFRDSILGQMKLQQQISVKGRFIGYDDLLEEFKLDQVSLSE